MAYRYGRWQGGPDPLEPPFDLAAALDRLGDRVLAGERPGDALSSLLRQGMPGLRGLRDLLRRVRERRRELRGRGTFDGTLEQVRELLDRALEQEREALAADPSDAARLAEAELDQLPPDTAGAVRQLADRQWRSPEAAATYERIRDLLRREVLDAQFRGMRQALAGASSEDLERVRDMLADLNAMLDADARGEDTTAAFDQFMQEYGDMFPERPRNLDELVDALARRAAAASRLLASLSPEQREELAALMQAAMADLGLERELDRLGHALQWRRPELRWGQPAAMGGDQALGLGDATTALEELADLEALEASLGQGYAGASLDDIDLEAVERALGRAATADVEALRALERELAEQGYLTREHGELKLTPKAIRRIGATALRRIFSSLETRRRGDHDVPGAGALGELTGSSRQWQFGDEQPLDVVGTVKNAVLRGAGTPHPEVGITAPAAPRPAVTLEAADFQVLETEHRTRAAVCLLVDLSYSMLLREAWGAAKSTALALHSLVSTRYPQDALQIIGFSSVARILKPGELADLGPNMEQQGTNLQHALLLAGRHLDHHPDAEPVILVVTDGEPTAHLQPGGYPWFEWPPSPETIELTMAAVLRLTRRGATINVFMLDTEPRLVRFVQALARLNGGRVFTPSSERLGDYVVQDYLRARRGRRAG
ncbi:MAG TPA: VWA domain-containing protein [Actinomycetes bacterium]|jgi:uncharacterized protein with von Willebrand factor type A (vWA) domain|nr:VWA domain-containing protein [Actinomycetes bacterium]